MQNAAISEMRVQRYGVFLKPPNIFEKKLAQSYCLLWLAGASRARNKTELD